MNLGIRRVTNQHGQSVVEFALIAPVVLLVMFGIVSFGLIFSWQNQLNNAAREGARAGAVCQTDAQIRQIVASNLPVIPHPETVAISITPRNSNGGTLSAGQRERGGSITVQLNYTADVVPIPGVLAAKRALVGRSTFRMECDTPAP